MKHGTVLNRGSFANDDVTIIAAQYSTGPHRGLAANRDAADDYGLWVNIRVRGNGWLGCN